MIYLPDSSQFQPIKVSIFVIALIFIGNSISAQTFHPCEYFLDLGSFDPVFMDFDKDGDFDALVSYFAEFRYYENTGDALSPVWTFQGTNPFNLTPVLGMNSPSFADIDGDGDQDLIIGRSFGFPITEFDIQFYENLDVSPMKNMPDFAAPVVDPFGLSADAGFPAPTLKDIDGDLDLDVFIGDINGHIHFFENTGDPMNPAYTDQGLSPYGITNSIDQHSAPEFVDIDKDGDCDLFIGARIHFNMMTGLETFGFVYQENTGTATNPSFGLPVINPFGIDTVTVDNPDPVFVDITNNGLPVIAVGTGGVQDVTQCFEAEELEPIPTMSEWGLILLGLSIAITGTVALRVKNLSGTVQ